MTELMTSERLAEIKAWMRNSQVLRSVAEAAALTELIAEVERLRADNARLVKLADGFELACKFAESERQARIVAWLRSPDMDTGIWTHTLADMIENGAALEGDNG